jgi:hypothetical protein
VGSAATNPYQPVTPSIPVLILVGRFDPLSPLPLVQQAAISLPAANVVEFPSLSHNVLGNDCPVAIRNAWIAHPKSPPDTGCIGAMAPVEFALPPPEADTSS